MEQIKQILDIVKTGDIKAAEAAIKALLGSKSAAVVSEGKAYVAKSLFEGDDAEEEDEDSKEDKAEDKKEDDKEAE